MVKDHGSSNDDLAAAGVVAVVVATIVVVVVVTVVVVVVVVVMAGGWEIALIFFSCSTPCHIPCVYFSVRDDSSPHWEAVEEGLEKRMQCRCQADVPRDLQWDQRGVGYAGGGVRWPVSGVAGCDRVAAIPPRQFAP